MKKARAKEKSGAPAAPPEQPDEYRAIAAEAAAEIRILGSRFIALARPCVEPPAFDAWLREIRAAYHDATHHCYAWRIGKSDVRTRFSDDGEPSGTAGKRILGALESSGLTETGLIVVRYFGGTKLGVAGLGRAYHDAAAAVLATARSEIRTIRLLLEISFPPEQLRIVHHLIDRYGAAIVARGFDGENIYRIALRRSRVRAAAAEIAERCRGEARLRILGEA